MAKKDFNTEFDRLIREALKTTAYVVYVLGYI